MMIFNSEYCLDRLLTHAKSTGVASQLIYSNPGTLHYKVYHKNMDENSFQDIKGIQTMFQQPNTALLRLPTLSIVLKNMPIVELKKYSNFHSDPYQWLLVKILLTKCSLDKQSWTLEILEHWTIL